VLLLGDLVGDAEAECRILIKLQQARQFTFADDLTVLDVGSDYKHGSGQSVCEYLLQSISRCSWTQVGAIPPHDQPNCPEHGLERVSLFGSVRLPVGDEDRAVGTDRARRQWPQFFESCWWEDNRRISDLDVSEELTPGDPADERCWRGDVNHEPNWSAASLRDLAHSRVVGGARA
jgi:hypothetical protein